MKLAGYLLIAIGFLGGALTSVVDEIEVAWGYYLASLLAGVAGIVCVRIAHRRIIRAVTGAGGAADELERILARVVENARALTEAVERLDPRELNRRVSEAFPDDLAAFAMARERIAHLYGLQAYADVMSHFAAGERYLNRVWSSSADGYIDEAREYVGRSSEQFGLALERLSGLRNPGAAP